MRQLLAVCVLLLCCGFASAQDAWTYPGQYAEPSAPRLSTPVASPGALPTPSLALDTPPTPVSARGAIQSADPSVRFFDSKFLSGLWWTIRNRPGCRNLSDGLWRGPTGGHRSSEESEKGLYQPGRSRGQRGRHNQISWQAGARELAAERLKNEARDASSG